MEASGTPGLARQRSAASYKRDWSMVWGEPIPCASGGRSAVQAMSGTPAWWASVTAGRSSAAAVPLVVATTAGRPLASPIPSAKKAADRSSRKTCSRISSSARSANNSGVEREPGVTTASVTPARRHSSTMVAQNVAATSTALPALSMLPALPALPMLPALPAEPSVMQRWLRAAR
jgi:hypothetical protein